MTSNYWKWIVVVLALAALGGCIGENREQAEGMCLMELTKIHGIPSDKQPYTIQEGVFVSNCMQSHGYLYSFSSQHNCNMEVASYLVASCYEPVSIENKIRHWIER